MKHVKTVSQSKLPKMAAKPPAPAKKPKKVKVA